MDFKMMVMNNQMRYLVIVSIILIGYLQPLRAQNNHFGKSIIFGSNVGYTEYGGGDPFYDLNIYMSNTYFLFSLRKNLYTGIHFNSIKTRNFQSKEQHFSRSGFIVRYVAEATLRDRLETNLELGGSYGNFGIALDDTIDKRPYYYLNVSITLDFKLYKGLYLTAGSYAYRQLEKGDYGLEMAAHTGLSYKWK